MANKKVPSEGGNARGHSNMEHGLHTDEIKQSARKRRRRENTEGFDFCVKIEDFGLRASAPGARNET